jgi:hypothetical protein
MLDAWVQGVEVLLGEEELDKVYGEDSHSIDDPEKLIEHLKEQKGVLMDYEEELEPAEAKTSPSLFKSANQ